MTTVDPTSLFTCPQCGGGNLRRTTVRRPSSTEERMRCPGCGVTYPIRRGVPILLPDEAERPVGDERAEVRSGPARAGAASGNGGATVASGTGGGTAASASPGAAAASGTAGPPAPRTPLSLAPRRLRAAGRVIRNQGIGPFWQKAVRGVRTEAERRVPGLRRGPRYTCPCCGTHARFVNYRGRPRAQCPSCGAKERDRLLVLVLREILAGGGAPIVLHVAPERTIRRFLSSRVDPYMTVDLTRGLTSYAGTLSAAADLTRLPFASDSFDLVLASHVLEHIGDDHSAIREVMRVLRPGGIAVLPVPIVHRGGTVEYGAPRADEEMHVRAPGLDYFDRYGDVGFQVVVRCSSDYPDEHQLHSWHAHWESLGAAGARAGAPGASGNDQYVPICLKPGAGSVLSFDATRRGRVGEPLPGKPQEARG